MLEITSDMLLYHGSYCEVRKPMLARCAKHKDFGQGFYLTTSREQAERFARISTRRAISSGYVNKEQQYGVVSVFRCGTLENLAVKIFLTADDMCISLLLPERLKNQFCFRTEKALECLIFKESTKYGLKA